jgi:hypothetical protein
MALGGLVLLSTALACTKPVVHAAPPVPGLIAPEPPDRLIVPTEVVVPDPPAAAVPTPTTPVKPTTVRSAASDRPSTPAPPASVPAAAAAAESLPPSQVLQTSGNLAELEQRAQASITQVEQELNRIQASVQQLPANARAQYDAARGFVRSAKDALRVKNVVLARELADKAASLASQLAK